MTSNISIGELREAMSCNVCMEEYNQASKKPLVLPCGHTFCRSCLVTLEASKRDQCPTCRAQHNVQVEALTVNYSLLSIIPTPLPNDVKDNECATHKNYLRYFCWTCWQPLCGLCLHSGHPQDHNVILTEAPVHKEKLKLVEEIREIFSTLKAELRADFTALDGRVKELFRRNANMHNTAAVFFDKIQMATDIPSLECLKKEVEEEKNRLSSDHKTPAGMSKNSPDVVKTTKSSIHVLQQQQSLAATQVRSALMDFRDGRLLLHSLAQPDTTSLSLQMPSEVFLELSVGDRRLGCVYITLWSHMRLAQQFLALCMGTMGPSLMGIKAQSKVKNLLMFRFGFDGTSQEELSNAQSITSPLLTNLEWGGIYEKPAAKGYIMNGHYNYGLSFGICTMDDKNTVIKAPFGKVVAGLDVIRNAALHKPLTEVTVTNCGLALTGLYLVPQ